jgi:hypothetical protein
VQLDRRVFSNRRPRLRLGNLLAEVKNPELSVLIIYLDSGADLCRREETLPPYVAGRIPSTPLGWRVLDYCR